MRVAIGGLILCMLWPCQALGASDAMREATRERLDRGEVIIKPRDVRGSDFPLVVAMAVVDAPPSKVWRLVDDCENYAVTLPTVSLSEEIRRTKRRVRCKVTIKLPLLPDLTSVTDATQTVVRDKRYIQSWRLVNGDYHKNTGTWTLVPFDDEGQRTLVVYEVHVEPKMRISRGIQSAAMRKTLPRMFESIRNLTDG